MARAAWARLEWWAVLGGRRSLRKEVSQERSGLGGSEAKGRELGGDEQRRKRADNPGGRQFNLLAESGDTGQPSGHFATTHITISWRQAQESEKRSCHR